MRALIFVALLLAAPALRAEEGFRLSVGGTYFRELDRALGRVAARYGREARYADVEEAMDALSPAGDLAREEVDAAAAFLRRHQREALLKDARAEGLTLEDYFAAHDAALWTKFSRELDALKVNASGMREGDLLARLIAAREYLGLQHVKPNESLSHRASAKLDAFASETFKVLGLPHVRSSLPVGRDDGDVWNYLLGLESE